ncbi:host cell division inhibitor Icd-like protein [Escherichia coli]
MQENYINRVAKRHNCRITGKTKATRYGGPSTQATRYPQRISADYYAVITSGWQCDQCAGLLVGYSCSLVSPCCDVFQACDPIFVRLYSLRNFSRTNAHGANLSCSCSLTAFLRCFFLDEDNFFNDLSVIVDTCNPVRHSSPHHGAGDGYSCSLALRRWRYSTSRFNAAVTNCPVLSPGIFTASTLFITSCGTLAATVCDFAFTAFVAMLCTPYKKQMQYAGKKISVQHLTCLTPGLKLVFNTLLMQGAETTTPRSGGTHAGRLTTNDSKSIEVAMRNHTTHPQGRDSHNLNKYIWRFIALSTAQPRVITIEATSEQEARQQSPAGCVMVFAARIRQGVHHVQ